MSTSKFVESCKNIGQTALEIDTDFIRVKDGFDDLVKNYVKDFSEIASKYVPDWARLMARWTGEEGLLSSSKKLAAKTAATLTLHGEHLQLVAEIADEKDLKEVQAELQNYVDTHRIKVGTEVADGFKDHRNDIERFSKHFTQYLVDEGKRFTKEAEGYEKDIKTHQAEVDSIPEKIKKVLISLCCAAAFGIAALIINASFLIHYLIRRKNEQEKLDKAKAELERVKKEQNALAAMQADFENLKPHIDEICSSLGIFAVLWAFMIEQCTEINTTLNEGMHVVSTNKFRIKFELLRRQVEPLKEGMRQYATPSDTGILNISLNCQIR